MFLVILILLLLFACFCLCYPLWLWWVSVFTSTTEEVVEDAFGTYDDRVHKALIVPCSLKNDRLVS